MGVVEMEKQEINKMEHEQAEHAIRKASGTAHVMRALKEPGKKLETITDDVSTAASDYQDAIDDAIEQMEEMKKN